MGDLPKINGKIGKKFPNRGEGGSPIWEKFPHFPGFFCRRPLVTVLMQVMLDKINCPVVYATLEVLVMHLGRVAEAANRMDIDNLGLLFGQVMVDDSKDRIFSKKNLFRFFFGPTPRLQWMQSSFQVN